MRNIVVTSLLVDVDKGPPNDVVLTGPIALLARTDREGVLTVTL